MGTAYDKFIKKANAEARQNRINRVVKRTAPYGRGLGKSHKQYIAGDLMSSAKNRAYGYKMNGIKPLDQSTGGQDPYLYKQQQEGYNPYEFKYVYTGIPTWVKGGTSARGKKYEGFWSRNRMATDEEKDLYKKTGNLDFNQAKNDSSYAIMRSHDADAKTFKDQLNTPTWDGLDVAKKRVNNGSSKFEYLKGFLKDVVADPVFDALKTFDYGESALTGGIAGAIEESRNVFDAIADKDVSKIDFMRPIKNISESVEHSEKTGWGKSMSQYFSEAVDRQDKKELDRLNSLPQDAYTKLQIKNIKDKQNNKANKIFETAMGFAGDIGSPIHLGTGMVRVGKKVTGDAVDSFNDLRKGTADLSMGIVPKHIREANQKKAMEIARKNMEDIPVKKTSNVLDTLHETKPMNDIKMFEDNALEHSLNKGFNRAMDNDIDKVIKSNPATQNLGNFLDNIKPQKSGVVDDFENIFESSDVPNSKLGKEIFFKKIDDLPDKESDEVLDWLSEYNPKVYDEYLNASDDINDFVNDAIHINNINTKADNTLVNNFNNNAKHIVEKPKYDYAKIDKMSEENAIEKIARMFDDSPSETKLMNNYHRKDRFEKTIRSLSDDIYNGKIDGEDLSKTIQDVKGKDVPAKIKREYINNKLFNGEEVISSNVGNKSIDDLIDSIDDMVNLRRVTDNYIATGEILPVKLSESTKSFLKLTDDVNIKGSKVNGIVNDSPEELLETLNKSIINRSRALTDERYSDKLQLMARKFGYENYNNDILKSIDNLKSELKRLDKLPYSKETVSKKLEISSNLKRLNGIKKDRGNMWNKIKNITEDEFDNLVSSKYPEHMQDMSSYTHKANQTKEIQNLSDPSNVEKSINEVLNNHLDEPMNNKRTKFIDDVESLRGHRGGTDITKGDEVFNESKLLKSVELEPVIKIPKLSKNYKPTFSHLEKMPGAKHVVSNVKKLLTKIIEYDTPVVRKIDGKMQVAPFEFESKTLRKELNRQIEMMRKAGIEDYTWFEDIKRFKADLLKNTERGKLDLNELSGASVKRVNKIPEDIRLEREMNETARKLFIEDEYERIINSSNADELFQAINYEKYIPQKGDNIGTNIPKTNTSAKEDFIPIEESVKKEGFKTPEKADKYVNKLDAFLHRSDEVADTPLANIKPRVRKKKSQAQIDAIDKTLERYSGANSLKQVTPKDGRLPKLSELINNGFSKDEAFEILEKMKRGEIEIPSHNVTTKVNEKTGWKNTNTSTDIDDLKRVLDDSPNTAKTGDDVKHPSFEEFKSNFNKDNHMKYEDSKIYDIYKRWLNTWKKGLTVYNPGWHAQNFFQNKGQNYLAIGSEAFSSQKNARRLLSYIQGGKNKVDDVVDLKNGKIYSGDDLKALVKRNKVVNSQTNDIIESRGVIPPLETKIDNSWIMEKLGHSEDTARLHHFIKQLERGMSPEDATKSVNKYLFDYNNKTKFDKVMGDFVDPFWIFHKNYAKLLGKSAIENPSAINNILRGERGLENGLSENDRNSTSKQWDFIQSPHNSFKDDKNGKIYDFLYKQKLMPRIQDAIPTNMDDAENKLNPILRLALQQSRNEGNFHNKVVDKDKAGWNEVTKEDRNKEIALELNPFINSFAKAVKNSNKRQKSADEGKQSQSTSDKQAFYDWVQFITGVKGNYYRR